MSTHVDEKVPEIAELTGILERQRQAFLRDGFPDAATRKDRISRLCLALLDSADELAKALNEDYGQRPEAVTKSFEILGQLADARYILEHLDEWMEPIDLGVHEGVSAFLQKKPLGVVGVIGAWNYPITLSIQPAVAALAAGNRVMIKFPDLHERTGAVLQEAVRMHLAEDEVAVITGGIDTAVAFSNLRFDHIIFTGSAAIGRAVAEAAGRNLVPVTLELGGKNPAVVSPSADLVAAARSIGGARLINSGQLCVCPDYVFVPNDLRSEFIDHLVSAIRAYFPEYRHNPGVVSIVNDRNYQRVLSLVDDAVRHGATRIDAVTSGDAASLPDPGTRIIQPIILTDVPANARIAGEEIFGPVLVVYGYDSIDEVIDYVNDRPSPLAAYWYGGDDADFHGFIARTTSGGLTRNDALLHAFVENAPFGGVGSSGCGAYHGRWGFDLLTHRRTIATATTEVPIASGAVGAALASTQTVAQLDAGIAAATEEFRSLTVAQR